MDIDLEELKRKAEAAGADHPWHWHADPIKGDPLGRSRYEITTLGRTITRTYYSDSVALHEAAFIAAANPQAVLALIARIQHLESANSGLRKMLDVCEADDDDEILDHREDRGPREEKSDW